MRIVDKRKDYYDGLQRLDEDRELLFIRHESEQKIPGVSLPEFSWRGSVCINDRFLIGFCGQLYLGVVLYVDGRDWNEPHTLVGESIYTKSPYVTCYSADHVSAFIGRCKANVQKQYDLSWMDNKWLRTHSSNSAAVEQFFKPRNGEKVWGEKLLLDIRDKHPIFSVQNTQQYQGKDNLWHFDSTLTISPLLNRYSFQRVKPPQQAYQDIRMWLSNKAAPEKPIPELSNEDLAASKGHGGKYSFRTPPSKKRGKK